jgi:hypothetical protein
MYPDAFDQKHLRIEETDYLFVIGGAGPPLITQPPALCSSGSAMAASSQQASLIAYLSGCQHWCISTPLSRCRAGQCST